MVAKELSFHHCRRSNIGAKILRLRAKLRQRREEKRNKITNKKMPFMRRGINGIG
jgi:hypothetical protein